MKLSFKNREDLENTVRLAFEIDKSLPRVKPERLSSLLGKMVIIPDGERSPQDILEDISNRKKTLTHDDIYIWDYVMTRLLPILNDSQREVFILRIKGFGWKKIAKVLVDKKLSDRHLSRITLWRIYKNSIYKLLNY